VTLGSSFWLRVPHATGFVRLEGDPVRRRAEDDPPAVGYGSNMERRLRTFVGSPWTVAMLVLVFSQWEVWVAGPTHLVGPRWAAAASLGVGSLFLVGRRRAPLTAQTVVAVVTCLPWLVWGASQVGSSFLLGVVSTYAVGRWGRRPVAYLGVPIAGAWALLQIARDPLQAGVAAGWGWVLYAVVSWAAGAWVRQNSELNGRRDAERVARSRAELAEQRLGIARDLHDVLANSLGVMVVHAEAAEEVLAGDPERAARAMRRVQTSGREALHEVRTLLGPLRVDDHQTQTSLPVTGADLKSGQPARSSQLGLSDIDELISRMRTAGLPVDVTRREIRSVPAGIGEVVYRVVQESLTNTMRHAGLVDTCVRLEATAHAVTVEVTDEGRAGDADVTTVDGHGLAGMRDRVQRVGGTLQAGPRSGGGFAVSADIPLASPHTASSPVIGRAGSTA
jgi:signal transduction histidine kinase